MLEENTTKFRCIRRVARKLPLALSCLPVGFHVRVKQPVSQLKDFCDILNWEILLQLCRENSNLKSEKKLRHCMCDLVLFLWKTPLGKNIAEIFAQTALPQGKGLNCIGWEWSDFRPCAHARLFLCVSFLQTVVKRQTRRLWNKTCCDFFLSPPLLNSRPYAHFHTQSYVSFEQHDIRGY
jgi:hypothetical protein